VDESSGDKNPESPRFSCRTGTLRQGARQTGTRRLDACLMGSFETAQALEPVAHFMVASEELAPARGWNYDALLKSLVEKPTSNGYDLDAPS